MTAPIVIDCHPLFDLIFSASGVRRVRTGTECVPFGRVGLLMQECCFEWSSPAPCAEVKAELAVAARVDDAAFREVIAKHFKSTGTARAWGWGCAMGSAQQRARDQRECAA